MKRKSVATLMLLALLNLNFGMLCGSPGDVDAAQCCASNAACHNDGMNSPEACCRKERNSRALAVIERAGGPLQVSGLLHVGTEHLAVLAPHIPHTVPLGPVSSSERDARGAPLKLPPRDLVTLNAIFLI